MPIGHVCVVLSLIGLLLQQSAADAAKDLQIKLAEAEAQLHQLANEKNAEIAQLADDKAKLANALFETRFACAHHAQRLGSSVAYDIDSVAMPATWNWTLCKSEGGPLNCAKCNVTGVVGKGAGALRCDLLVPDKRKKQDPLKGKTCAEYSSNKDCPAKCPDDFLGSFWYVIGGAGVGRCFDFSETKVRNSPPDVNTYFRTDVPDFLPGATGSAPKGDMMGSYIFTKMTTSHPNKMSRDVGVLLAKRGILHKHSQTDDDVADVYKVGHCLQCKENVFSSADIALVTDKDHENFYLKCVKFAFNGTHLKDDYQCDRSSQDYKLFEAMLGGF